MPLPLIFLLCMVLAWFVLVKLLFNRLEKFHPEKYESMGRPSLFWRNSTEGAFKMMKFLFLREHKKLGDHSLSGLSDFMLVFFLVYLLIFFSMFFGVMFQIPRSAP